MSGLDDAGAPPATLDLHHADEPDQSHTDKRFLFSEAGGQRSVWVVRGCQVPKLTVLTLLCAGLGVLSLILAIWCGQLHRQQGQQQDRVCASAAATDRRLECETTGCLRQAAEIAGYVNRSVTPCEDFYEYACGLFDNVHPLGTHITYGIQNVLESANKVRVEELLEKKIIHNDLSATSKAKTFYDTCMASFYNTSSSDQLRGLVNDLGGLDLFGTFNGTNWSFTDIFFRTREVHRLRLFFSITWLQTMNRIMVTLPRLGIKNTTMYADKSERATTIRKAYKTAITAVLSMVEQDIPNPSALNRSCNTTCVERIADDVILMETQIAKAMPASGRSQVQTGPDQNVMDLTELDQISSQFHWRELLDTLFGPGVIPADSSVQVPSRDYMLSINAIIKGTNVSVINNYIKWNLIRWYLPAMGPMFSTLSAELDYITRGAEMKPREEVCYDFLRHYFPRAVRALFIKGHIGEDNVAAAKRMIWRIKNHLAASFNWMSTSARATSQNVLNDLSVDYGHSPWVTDSQKLNDYYREVSMSTKNFFKNILNVDRFKASELKANARKLGNDDDSDDDVWVDGKTADTKITYSPVHGSLTVPAGILQVPVFNHENPDYINAATLGSLVLRELATPFFLRHRTHRLPNWWDSATSATYRRYSRCVMDSLDNYTVRVEKGFEYKSAKSSGVHTRSEVRLDPRKSAKYVQSEHLAFRLSYSLFNRLLAEDGPQLTLPGTQGQTPEQLFFLTYAQSRCRHTNPYLKVLLNSAFKEFPHPEMVNNFVYNSPEFMEAFKCQTVPAKHMGKQCKLE